MAAPVRYRPLRPLIALMALIVGFGVWAFFPGTDSSIKLGLDLQGGTQVVLIPEPVVEGADITDDQLAQTVEILRARVDSLGVAESEVTITGSGNDAAIVVSVPGENQDRLVELVQQTALLDFRPVWSLLPPRMHLLSPELFKLRKTPPNMKHRSARWTARIPRILRAEHPITPNSGWEPAIKRVRRSIHCSLPSSRAPMSREQQQSCHKVVSVGS